ncbi:NYN domain-containing protein [Streptococcus merionis]|uniref:NYN domain n=1 Tax=Streptococcus merionis TaxID=400065 RepID=A0A239T177_9STRE|nr:NYN domain-containing protein [Streptococcus merionis]SNU90858.1 NYN domain [Streptococcus merionis]
MDLLLIDNSNIFIGLNQFEYGARIDYIKFVKKYTNNNNQKKVLAGSTPPPNDSFWRTMENNNFEVHTYERTKSGEKGVDGKILIEGMKHIERIKSPGKLILMSGDLDMRPLIEEAFSQKWEIILWSWKDSISSEYEKGDLRYCFKETKYLDDIADEVVYFNNDSYSKEYLGNRKLRLAREKQEQEFDQAKKNAKDKISGLQYITDRDIYLAKIDELTDFKQISEVDNILSSAKMEDDKLKKVANEKAAEQRREQQRKQDQEVKKQAKKEKGFWKRNKSWIAGGIAAASGIVYAIKKSIK